MAYTKTNWVNNTTPINDTNLNKIEQGIYDNSIVVDAVTNTLNPTDTETYKTAELTEGQITDVIGVNDIVIKGQTSQDGTPTPSAPVDVNVVSGSNVVNTSNKNLFIPTLKVDNTPIYVNNGTVSLIKDEYTFIASNTDMYFGEVGFQNQTYVSIRGQKIYRNGNTNISVLVTNTTFNKVHITAYNSQGVSLGYTVKNGNSTTYTFPENCEFVTIRIGKNNAVAGTVYKTKVMVVYGDTIPTTYKLHQGKELPLDLGSIELCKIGDYQDYFYKSGSKWYLHKEIGRIILNGTESWSYSSANLVFYTDVINTLSMKNSNAFCNRFKKVDNSTAFENMNNGEIILQFSSTLNARLVCKYTSYTSAADFKTWLASNNTIVYYPLATQTNTEITDTTLISQLEAIYNAPLYEQTNITQTNNDLPMVLDITACKDNLNGIKAFIRK